MKLSPRCRDSDIGDRIARVAIVTPGLWILRLRMPSIRCGGGNHLIDKDPASRGQTSGDDDHVGRAALRQVTRKHLRGARIQFSVPQIVYLKLLAYPASYTHAFKVPCLDLTP
jgi:hypothetical protein